MDLNGHTISGTVNPILEVAVSAKLTITDSSSEKKGAITATGGSSGVSNYGTLEVSGGTITATGENGCGVNNYGTLEVRNGAITATGVSNRGEHTRCAPSQAP